MTTINKIKQELLVWSIIISVFAVMTLVAINIDSIRQSPLFHNDGAKESKSSQTHSEELYQPGNSVVLAQ